MFSYLFRAFAQEPSQYAEKKREMSSLEYQRADTDVDSTSSFYLGNLILQ